jgi:glycine dehydrogenase subunit 2
MCHFNVHKTFGTPHGSSGPATGALCVRDHLAKYLPVPTVEYNGQKYWLDYDRPESVGKIRSYLGAAGVVLRAYAWTMMLGDKGLRECAEISVINNNYMQKLMQDIPYMDEAFKGNGIVRQEQIRYSFGKLAEKTGVGSEDMNRRMLDYGIPWFWSSHHPWVIPEPMTLEPCETYTKEDIEEYVEVVRAVVKEALKDPDFVKGAPYDSVIRKRKNERNLDDPKKWALTYKVFRKKFNVK